MLVCAQKGGKMTPQIAVVVSRYSASDALGLLYKSRIYCRIWGQDPRSLALEDHVCLSDLVLNNGFTADDKEISGNVRIDRLKTGNSRILLDCRFFLACMAYPPILRDLLSRCAGGSRRQVVFDGTYFFDERERENKLFVLGASLSEDGLQAIWHIHRLNLPASREYFSVVLPCSSVAVA